jgi:hypothetical protein
MSLWSTCAGVQEGLAAALCILWQCGGAKEALGLIWLLCSDTLSVRLCRLGPASPRCAFWRLLSGIGGRLVELMCRPRSPQALRCCGGTCLLVSHMPCA